MAYNIFTTEWDDRFPANWTERRMLKEVARALRPSSDIVAWHETVGIPLTRASRITHSELARGCGKNGGDLLLLTADLGYSFERKDHAALFKLSFGGAA